MITFFRSYFLKKALSKANSGVYKGWDDARDILIVYDQNSKEDGLFINKLSKRFETDQKKVHFIKFIEGKKPKENVPPNTYYKRDVTLCGKPKKAVVKGLDDSCDILVDWTKGEKSPNEFISIEMPAKFKVGINKQLPCFDMVVKNLDHEDDKIIEEILKYLKMINHG